MDKEVAEILHSYATNEQLRKRRLRIYYGDLETGKVAPLDTEVMGYVRIYLNSMRSAVQYMLLSNASAMRGIPVRDNILKIVEVHGGEIRNYVAYQHPKYQEPYADVRWSTEKSMWSVWCNGNCVKLFAPEKEEKAHKYADFLVGRRNNR